MEPFMRVEISIDGKYLHAVLADFSQHRADILDVTERNELKVSYIHCHLCIGWLDGRVILVVFCENCIFKDDF